MRKLAIEYTPFNYKDKEPNYKFFNELSKQITPTIAENVINDVLRENLSKLVCISIDFDSYLRTQYCNGVNTMKMKLEARSSALILCDITVTWQKNDQSRLYPWDDLKDDAVHFKCNISESELKCLNRMLPQLYHPVIKSSSSGLPFDYQIFFGAEKAILYLYEPVSEGDISEFNQIATGFFEFWNAMNESKIHSWQVQQSGKKQITITLDWHPVDEYIIKCLLGYLKEKSNIKRIVFI